jgi:hypothetical protein
MERPRLETERGKAQQKRIIERSRKYLEFRLHPLVLVGGDNFRFIGKIDATELKLWEKRP